MQRQRYDDLVIQQSSILDKYSAARITSQLRDAIAEADGLSESKLESFLDGDMSPEDFVKAYKESRKLYHLRAIKLETLASKSQSLLP